MTAIRCGQEGRGGPDVVEASASRPWAPAGSRRAESALPILRGRFTGADPYPHVVVEGLLRNGIAEAAGAAFPTPDADLWTHYRHVNEDKLGSPHRDRFPRAVSDVVAALQTPEFVSWLGRLTGTPGLFPDPSLEGAGMHRSGPGGFLHVHTDFQRHHHHPGWRRTVNLILFLNPDWDADWGGAIDGPDAALRAPFSPTPITRSSSRAMGTASTVIRSRSAPPDRARKSLALYYYTQVDGPLDHEHTASPRAPRMVV